MKLFIYCAGGFGNETVDLAKRINAITNSWDEICFIDDDLNKGPELYGLKVFTFDKVISAYEVDSFEVSIANGEPFIREDIYRRLINAGVKMTNLIDSTAIISPSVRLGASVILPSRCFVSSSAIIDDNVALNTNSLIGHDVRVGRNSVISSAVNIAGNCVIGENVYIGMGAQIKQGVTIGSGSIIGMGSIVYNDIPDNVVVLGNPARIVKKNEDKRVFNK